MELGFGEEAGALGLGDDVGDWCVLHGAEQDSLVCVPVIVVADVLRVPYPGVLGLGEVVELGFGLVVGGWDRVAVLP